MMGGYEVWEPQEEEETPPQNGNHPTKKDTPNPVEPKTINAPRSTQEVVTEALQAKDVDRRRVFAVLGVLAAFGIVSSILLNRPQRTVKQLQNVQTPQEQVSPVPSSTPAAATELELPTLEIDATTQARNESLGQAILETEELIESAKNARRGFLLAKSQSELEGSNVPRDITLLREIYRQVERQQEILINSGEFSGSAKHQEIILPLLTDAYAALEALRIIWGVEAPNNTGELEEQAAIAIEAVCASGEYNCPSSYEVLKAMERSGVVLRPTPDRPTANGVVRQTVRPAELNKYMADLWRLGAVVRRRTHEQQLRELGIPDSEAMPPQPSASPSPQPKAVVTEPSRSEEKTNGLPK